MVRALILVALASLALAASPPKEGGNGHHAASEQIEQTAPHKAALPGESGAEHNNPPCKQGEDNRNSDLCAQWKAADAATASAYWTAATYWLGVGGLLIGALTLLAASAAALFARKAALETEKGAGASLGAVEATREANRISEDTAGRQLRAYIGVIDAKSYYFGHALPRIVIKIKNFGATPAYGVRSFSRLFADTHLTAHPGQSGTVIFATEFGIVEPGHEPIIWIDVPRDFVDVSLIPIREGLWKLFAETWIEYEDFRGRNRRRSFIYYLPTLLHPSHKDPGIPMKILAKGNEAD